jgi:hypothetical protein
LIRWGAGGAEVLADKVKATEGNEKGLGWWGGLRRKIVVVRPRIVIYPRRMALRRVAGVGGGVESARDVGSEGGVFKIGDGRDGGADFIGGERVGEMCEVSEGWWGGEGGMWSRYTFSLARLEPTRTGVGVSRGQMDCVVGVRRQEP